MAHELKLLSLTDVLVESSFLVLARNMGTAVWVHTWGILILGNPAGPILVDTGASHPEIMERLGMKGRVMDEMQLENALAAHDVAIEDVAGEDFPTIRVRYPHDPAEGVVKQQYPPDELVGREYYTPAGRGAERQLAERLPKLRAAIRGTSPRLPKGPVEPQTPVD